MTAQEREITIDRRLLALPYRIELTANGCIVMTPLEGPGYSWEELAEQPILPADLTWKIETNGENQIFMSPPPHIDHQDFASQIAQLLGAMLPQGRAIHEVGVRTTNGTRVPDVVWCSHSVRQRAGRSASFVVAPEICVEVISTSNTKLEIEEKFRLYLEAGALEVWRCDKDGRMTFFGPAGRLKGSALCLDFPVKLNPFA